jgi:hypothetical protein
VGLIERVGGYLPARLIEQARRQDRTPLEHAGLALCVQLIIGLTTGGWWAGAAFGAAYFLGREIAQHEYKLWRPGERRDPWWLSITHGWSRDSVLDAGVPAMVVVLVALLVG